MISPLAAALAKAFSNKTLIVVLYRLCSAQDHRHRQHQLQPEDHAPGCLQGLRQQHLHPQLLQRIQRAELQGPRRPSCDLCRWRRCRRIKPSTGAHVHCGTDFDCRSTDDSNHESQHLGSFGSVTCARGRGSVRAMRRHGLHRGDELCIGGKMRQAE